MIRFWEIHGYRIAAKSLFGKVLEFVENAETEPNI
jgi:hypothetical protein